MSRPQRIAAVYFRYKFSWSPIGTLSNATAHGMWLVNGEIIRIPSGGALLDSAQPLNFLPGFNLEGYANKDSTVYTSAYGIDSATTVLRGTLRYAGFSNAMKGLVTLGYLSTEGEHLHLHRQSTVKHCHFKVQ